MSKFFKTKTRKVRINQAEYFSRFTGEELFEAHEKPLAIIQEEDECIVKYKRFHTVNHDVLDFLETVFTSAEFARIQKMCRMIRGEANLLYTKQGKLHNFDTLSEELLISRSRFYKFLEKLYAKGVIWKTNGYDPEFIFGDEKTKRIKMYILNPKLACQGRKFKPEVQKYFEQYFNF